MAYYYVKNGATAGTAGGTTKQTGAFSSLPTTATWGSVQSAVDDGGATTGDFIFASDLHNFTSTTIIGWNFPKINNIASGSNFACVMSVDDANCDTYKVGATEDNSSSSNVSDDLSVNGTVAVHGFTLIAKDWISHSNNEGSQQHFYDCTLKVSSTGNGIQNSFEGTVRRFYNCTLDLYASSGYLQANSGGLTAMYGGSVVASSGITIGDLFWRGWTAGGGTIDFVGVDLTAVDGWLIGEAGLGTAAEDGMYAKFQGCKLLSSVGFVEEALSKSNYEVLITNCGDTVAGMEYQYFYKTFGVTVEEDTSIYRDNSTAFPSGQQISLKCVTENFVVPVSPAFFALPSRYAELSSTATDTIRVHILSSATLTDGDVWLELSYQDGTVTTYNVIQDKSPQDVILGTGTPLTTNTEAWTGRTAENRYQIDIDTSGDPGADCVPIIRVYVAKASSTIYFCPTVELI